MKDKLAYIEQGEGIPVVLLHGFCESKKIWEHFIPALATECRVIAPDLPGFGGNPGVKGAISVDDAARQVADFLKQIDVQQAIIIGHSLGGYVNLALADLFPEIFKGLSLFHSTAKADSTEKKVKRDKTVHFLETHGMEPFSENFVPSLFAEKNHQSLTIQMAAYKKIVNDTAVKTAIAYTKAMRDRPERINVLQQAAYPCLFIAGKRDEAVPYEDMLEQSKLPQGHSQLISLENCAHMGMYEQEKASLDALLNFVKRVKNNK